LPTTKEHCHRWIIPTLYDPAARSENWLRFIAEVVPNPVDLRHLQEWMGYVLMSGNRWQRMLWLHGPSGTGKSTFIKAIKLILGPAATVVSVDKFDEYSVAQLANARVAMCTELSPALLRTSTIKSLVAGDPVRGRHPYGRPFDLTFTGKLVWGSNELPPLDQGMGMWRRIVPIGMYVNPKWVDHGLEDKLQLEVGGILNWAIEGLRRLVTEQLPDGDWPLPPSVQATIDEYKSASDTIVRFSEEELESGDHHVSTLELYQRYVSWAQERSHKVPPLGPRFYQDCRRVGLSVDKTYTNGMGPSVEYMRGGRLRPGIFGSVPYTVVKGGG
jgi:putative DNA primase/helicase